MLLKTPLYITNRLKVKAGKHIQGLGEVTPA